MSLTPGFVGSSYNEFWNVYIDYNQDGDFTDAGELAYQNASNSTINGALTIPAGAVLGTTRMRIQMQWNAYPSNSCQSYTYGEVEDYDLTINGGGSRLTNTDDQLGAKDLVVERPDWFLYPNPAYDQITLTTANNMTLSAGTNMNLLDVDGRVIRSYINQDAGLSAYKLDISWLKPGIYFLVIQDNTGVRSLRFIRKP